MAVNAIHFLYIYCLIVDCLNSNVVSNWHDSVSVHIIVLKRTILSFFVNRV